MSASRHSLRLDSFEDRITPATMNSLANYAHIHSSNDAGSESFGLWLRPNSVTTLRDTTTGETFRVVSTYDYPVFVRFITWGGNWNTGGNAAPSAPSGSGSGLPTTGSSGNSNPDASEQPTNPASANHATSNVAKPSQHASDPDISVPFGVSPSAGTVAAQAAAEAAAIAANYGQVATQPVVHIGRTEGRDWTTPAPTYIEGVDLPVETIPNPSQSDEPPQADQARPDALLASGHAKLDRPETVAIADPIPGILPFSLTTLQKHVQGILDQASRLDVSVLDEFNSTENYLWFGAAALVAGGALQTAWGRKSRASDPRTLGLDSVLVRWGERHAG